MTEHPTDHVHNADDSVFPAAVQRPSGQWEWLRGLVVLAEHVSETLVQVIQRLTQVVAVGVRRQEAIPVQAPREMRDPIGNLGVLLSAPHLALKDGEQADDSGDVAPLRPTWR